MVSKFTKKKGVRLNLREWDGEIEMVWARCVSEVLNEGVLKGGRAARKRLCVEVLDRMAGLALRLCPEGVRKRGVNHAKRWRLGPDREVELGTSWMRGKAGDSIFSNVGETRVVGKDGTRSSDFEMFLKTFLARE